MYVRTYRSVWELCEPPKTGLEGEGPLYIGGGGVRVVREVGVVGRNEHRTLQYTIDKLYPDSQCQSSSQ